MAIKYFGNEKNRDRSHSLYRWHPWRWLGRTAVRPYTSIFILSFSIWAFADPPQDLYKSGNALYAEGRFAEAAQKYQAAADTGFKNWVLEYNLGNACYRAGQLGKGILRYERAFRMNSGQGDVIYNLNLATAKAGDPELPSTALAALAWRLFYLLSINTLTLVTSLCFVLLCLWAGWALVSPSSPVVPGGGSILAAVVTCFVVSGSWLGIRIYLLEKPIGVVVVPVAEVRSGPNTTYPANFIVPEGRRVLILEEQEPIQGWLEIGVPAEGLKGWAPDTSVEVI
jgi:hypothetical protein